jgi:hypothetical protein
MRRLTYSSLFLLTSFNFCFASVISSDWFPKTPNERVTPGDICDIADSFRYPERIRYCERDVSKERKAAIFRVYDRELGFHTQEMNRTDFKMDHYIPLCMGGSNDNENLWPQHKTIYQHTDPIEPVLCELMAAGQILQLKAIAIIRSVKQHPETSEKVLRDLESQLRR